MPNERIEEISSRAGIEFTNVADFVWKAPRLIEHERELEREKLDNYFPNDSKFRRLRWKLESNNLDHTFPYLIAVGNLFSAMSLFESYLLMLAAELEPYARVKLRDINGNGINRLFTFFRKMGLRPETLCVYEQVQAAIKIRNCIMHASGILPWSRDNDNLRHIQSNGIYLSREHRNRRKSSGKEFNEVTVFTSPFGERLAVTNDYCHILCAYLRDYFGSLCMSASLAIVPTSGA